MAWRTLKRANRLPVTRASNGEAIRTRPTARRSRLHAPDLLNLQVLELSECVHSSRMSTCVTMRQLDVYEFRIALI
jgi:hypothetical protein